MDSDIDDCTALERLQAKSNQGAINVLSGLLADSRVQGIIKRVFLRETLKNGLIMSCFLIGLLKLYDVAKVVLGVNWVGELIASLAMILVGAIYIKTKMLVKE